MELLTHKAWFLLCPVLVGDVDSEAPLVVPRRGIPEWWLDLNGLAMQLLVGARTLVQPGYDGAFPIVFTGKLAEPVSLVE